MVHVRPLADVLVIVPDACSVAVDAASGTTGSAWR